MISLSATTGGVRFIFENSSYYLYGNGTIDTPVNSLLLVDDGSDAVTFKKIDGDAFVSAPVAEFGMSKSEIEAFYKNNMVGSTGGIDSGTVQSMIDESISGKADTSAVTAVDNALTAHVGNTAIHVTAGDKLYWDGKSDFSGSYNDLTDKPTIPVVPTSNTAFTNDAGYVTSGYVDSAVSGKQDTLVSGTNIKTINNQSLLGSGNIDIQGGGGSTYSAGTNISIANDTISCTLPIVNWGNYNIAFTDEGYGSGSHTLTFGDGAVTPSMYSMSLGNFTNARGGHSVAIGYGCRTYADFSNAFGYYTVTNNNKETAQGVYNNSVKASTTFGDSGNTLFSVGDGTGSNARHNAFEIRQNGDIYISKDGADIKLQDNLGGGGGGSYTAGDGINIENDVISTSYSGYPVFDSGTTTPEINLYNFEGQCLILCPIDCEGTQGDAHFDVDGHNYNFTFHPDNQTFDDNGDSSWQNYFSIEWDSDKDTFKLTTNENQPIDAGDDGCVRFLTSEIRYSGTTTDGINGALEVATKVDKQLGGLNFVRLTQEEYDALTTKNSDTLYIIVPAFGGLTVYYIIDGQAAQNEITLFNGGGESSGESSGSGGGSALPTTMIVDGVEETPVNTWRFEEGTHIVQYTFEDNTVPQMFLNGIDYVCEIEIGDDITTIADSFAGDGVFAGMPALQKATIGKNVTTIGDYAFNTSTNLSAEGIYVKATTPPTLGSNAFDNTDNCPIYVPASAVDTYKDSTSTGWNEYASRIQAIQ